jgi:hypothetical protein
VQEGDGKMPVVLQERTLVLAMAELPQQKTKLHSGTHSQQAYQKSRDPVS